MRDSLASERSFKSAASFKSFNGSNAPTYQMPLEKAIERSSEHRRSASGRGDRNQIFRLGVVILLLMLVAAFLRHRCYIGHPTRFLSPLLKSWVEDGHFMKPIKAFYPDVSLL